MKRWLGAIGVGLVAAACGGGGGHHGGTAPSTTVATPTTGVDQAESPFCITMTQLTDMHDPAAFPTEVGSILDDAVTQAPPALTHSVTVVAGVIRAAVAHTPTTAVDRTALAAALTDVGAYLTAHCGTTLPAVAGG